MKAFKTIVISLLIIFALGITGVFGVEYFIEKKLKVQKNLTYEEFKMTFGGNLSFKNLSFKNEVVDAKVESVKLSIGLWKLITSDTIVIQNSTLKSAHVVLYQSALDSLNNSSDSIQSDSRKNQREFALRTVDLKGLDFYRLQSKKKNSDTLTHAKEIQVQLELNDIKDIKFEQLKTLHIGYFRQKAGVLQDIAGHQIDYNDNVLNIDTFKVFTRYSKENYINYIPEQKDHVDLVAHGMVLDSLHLDLNQNALSLISLNEINVDSFDLNVFRNKHIPPYSKIKPTYGQMIQKLNFKIDANALIARNSKISYAMTGDKAPISKIDLKNVNAKLSHIHNIPEKNQNAILSGTFSLSDNSLIGVDYSYNQFAHVETFVLDIHATNIETSSVNSMLRPEVNAELNGLIKELKVHMSAQGTADGSLKIKSQNIEVDVYNKKGEERKVVSFIASKLLNPPIEKESKIEGFERDKTRSMWHFSWYFVLEGLKNTLL
ncbi:hypothetical protein CW751_13380 [Brumimicrobium salinarum]|uniref:DUF748 domain-containing protein n=1 Tax=Brumimicrobium salinarum TaxID=2058658 RepID=A0A2I0QZQ1_9FLAO|nr:hypothetical protein [Brumimicrobium salinarum]PKR79816.1 hypothetical protein CW751_13380 [Brumimicrobium salinarum]